MQNAERRSTRLLLAGALLVGACAGARTTNPPASVPTAGSAETGAASASAAANAEPSRSNSSCPAEPIQVSEIRPLVDKYCVSCHSASSAAGEEYDFTSNGALTARRRNIEAKLRLYIMPPPNAHQPSEAERMSLRCWAKS